MSYSVDVIGGISVYELALLLAWKTDTLPLSYRAHLSSSQFSRIAISHFKASAPGLQPGSLAGTPSLRSAVKAPAVTSS